MYKVVVTRKNHSVIAINADPWKVVFAAGELASSVWGEMMGDNVFAVIDSVASRRQLIASGKLVVNLKW